MDREWIERTINETIKVRFDYPTGYEPNVIPEVWTENVGQLVNIIAQAHEQELAEAVRDWVALRDEALAQVAVMAEVTSLLREQVAVLSGVLETIDRATYEMEKALSAAPKVLAEVVLVGEYDDISETWQYQNHVSGDVEFVVEVYGKAQQRFHGQQVNVIVTECSVVAEHGQNGEQGYKPGALLTSGPSKRQSYSVGG